MMGKRSLENLITEANLAATKGQMSQSVTKLEEALRITQEKDQRNEILKDLINRNVLRSRHKEAIHYAKVLQTSLEIKEASKNLNLFAIYAIGLTYVLALPFLNQTTSFFSKIFLKKKERCLHWSHLRALHFAFFWNNIDDCPQFAVLQLFFSATENEKRLSLAWLGYTACYAGHTGIGRAILLKTIRSTENSEEIAPLLAIGLQMGGRTTEAQTIYDKFIAECPNASYFYKLLSLTNLINLALTRGDLVAATNHITQSFSKSFSLSESRHRVIIFGSKAALLAVQGKELEALALLKKAEVVARWTDNNLDYVLFYRLAVMVCIQLERTHDAAIYLKEFRRCCIQYGKPKFYYQEYLYLLALLASNHLRWRRTVAAISLLFRSALLFNAGLLVRATRLSFNVVTSHSSSYWDTNSIAKYLVFALRGSEVDSGVKNLALTTERITSGLLAPFSGTETAKAQISSLLETIRETFSANYVIQAETISDLINRVLEDDATVSIINDETDKVKLSFADDTFFIGLKAPKTKEYKDDLVVGMRLSQLDVHSESLVEASLRIFLTQYVFLRSIEISREEQFRQQRLVGIAETTQMLAHDVRKPFTILKRALDILKSSNSPEGIKAISSQLVPEVERALRSVDGMLSDIIEMESKARPTAEEIAPETLIHRAIADTFGMYREADVKFNYDFGHRHKVKVDQVKVLRVLINIIENAIQALDNKTGKIWFNTIETEKNGNSFIQFCIGNSSSGLSPDKIEHLFDAFYTHGKKHGTGLGLASAKRNVEAHGGNIWCRSEVNSGTEFYFTLPSGDFPVAPSVCELPEQSRGMSTELDATALKRESILRDETRLVENKLIEILKNRRSPFQILIVDDEKSYGDSLYQELSKNSELKSFIKIHVTTDAQSALLKASHCHVAFVDIDLGEQSISGFELAKQMKEESLNLRVCIHSNHTLPSDHRMAFESGATYFLPKPASYKQLVELLLDATTLKRLSPLQKKITLKAKARRVVKIR